MEYAFQLELREFKGDPGTSAVWNTESNRSFNEKLQRNFGEFCVSTEYFGNQYHSGDVVNGIRHEDIRHTSFEDNTFDSILSSDVLEHVPDPFSAFHEIYRVLTPGGKFIFTVPYTKGMVASDVRARLRPDGSVEHLKEPLFHGDPIRADGILVFTLFGEDLADHCREAGLKFTKMDLYKPAFGIVGKDAVVFVAQKPLLDS